MLIWLMIAVAGATAPDDDSPPAPSGADEPIEEAPSEAPSGDAPAEAPVDDAPAEAENGGEAPVVGPSPAADPATPATTATTRDHAMFGGDEGATERDASIFDAPAPDPEGDPWTSTQVGGMLEAMAERDDRVVVGGRLFMRGVVRGDAEGAIAFDAPSLLDVFIDARPEDALRVFARGRVAHDPTYPEAEFPVPETPATQVLLDETWIKGDLGDRVFVTAGRQRIRWGTLQIWNPTDFLNPQKLDPLPIIDVRTGVDLLKVHVPFESIRADAYAILDGTDLAELGDLRGGGRLEWVVATADFAATALASQSGKQEYGFESSVGISLLELRAEVATTHGDPEPDFEQYDGRLRKVDRSRQWVTQTALGADVAFRYCPTAYVNIGAEMLFNPIGYDDPSLYDDLIVDEEFVPLYVGRRYLAGFVSAPLPGRFEEHRIGVLTLNNLSDRSGLVRMDYIGSLRPWFVLNVWGTHHLGEGELAWGGVFDPPTVKDAMPELAEVFGDLMGPTLNEPVGDPIVYVAPRWQLGIAASVAF